MFTWLASPHTGFSGPIKQTTEINLTGQESQMVGGKPVGYIQAQSRSWTRDYLEQIQRLTAKLEIENPSI